MQIELTMNNRSLHDNITFVNIEMVVSCDFGPSVRPTIRVHVRLFLPPLNGFFGAVRPPTVRRLAEVGQLVERAAPPAAAVHRPRRPLAHVPQHADRLELAESGVVVVSRRRVDQPTRRASS